MLNKNLSIHTSLDGLTEAYSLQVSSEDCLAPCHGINYVPIIFHHKTRSFPASNSLKFLITGSSRVPGAPVPGATSADGGGLANHKYLGRSEGMETPSTTSTAPCFPQNLNPAEMRRGACLSSTPAPERREADAPVCRSLWSTVTPVMPLGTHLSLNLVPGVVPVEDWASLLQKLQFLLAHVVGIFS